VTGVLEERSCHDWYSFCISSYDNCLLPVLKFGSAWSASSISSWRRLSLSRRLLFDPFDPLEPLEPLPLEPLEPFDPEDSVGAVETVGDVGAGDSEGAGDAETVGCSSSAVGSSEEDGAGVIVGPVVGASEPPLLPLLPLLPLPLEELSLLLLN
jgi:hypothetical protein